MSAKSEAADVAEKLASNLVKQGGKKVGSLVKSIFGSGAKKVDDVAKVATKTGSKKADDFVKSRPKTSRKVERSKILDPTDKNYVIDKRLAVTKEGLPVELDPVTLQRKAGPRNAKGQPTPAPKLAEGDAGIGRMTVDEWNRAQNRLDILRANANKAARKASGPGRVRTTFDVSRARFPKATYTAIPAAIGGTAYGVIKGIDKFTGEDPLSQDEWKTALGITETPGTTDTAAKDPNQVYYDRAREIAKADYLASVLNYPGAEALDPQSTLSRQYADSTAAAMNALAQQYEQAAGGISQRGQTGASAINDIYAQGAGVTDALATAPSDGMSGMIPVSGDAALAGQYSLAQGQSLADYLGASQAIDAQAANELAGYTKLLGPAYQSQYNLINQQYRNQADQQKSMRDFDSQIRRDEKLRDALSTIAMQEAEDARTAAGYQPDPIEAAQYLIEWEGLDDNEKNAFKAAGVDTRAKYIEWRRNQKQQADLGL